MVTLAEPMRPQLPVVGSGHPFLVTRVFCVGRNYAAHAREMGADTREPPFFFMKPAVAVVDASQPTSIGYPPRTSDLQHEVELVVAIGTGGRDLDPARALEHVYGYAIGLDMTRRDLQRHAKDKGQPWEFAKSFLGSAPIGAIHKVIEVGHPREGAISLSVNGQVRQSSNLSQMTWSVAECLAQLSAYDALLPGDLLMTGTPEGVGRVVRGDVMRAQIAGLTDLAVAIAP
jgi:fumarylpyruvate hydrolase